MYVFMLFNRYRLFVPGKRSNFIGKRKRMKLFALLTAATLSLAFLSCEKDTTDPPPPPIVTNVLLKDVVVQSLPSPYYHFEYDASGRATKAGFSSGLKSYDVEYASGRIKELKSTNSANKDRVIYEYDNTGKVGVIKIVREDGTVYRRAFLTYDAGNYLKELEWEVKIEGVGFAVERTLTFSYYSDGNLEELRYHNHLLGPGHPEAVYTDRFEQYDDKINTDAFMLWNDFNQHVVLLPGVTVQKNNPQKNTRTGDGVNYSITYTYTYNTKKHPVQKIGDMLMTNGPDAGKHFALGTMFSYYE
jgi:hypothetical protein